MARQQSLESLAVHSAFAVHILAKWVADASGIIPWELSERLGAHIAAIEGALAELGHTAIRSEFEATEDKLHHRE